MPQYTTFDEVKTLLTVGPDNKSIFSDSLSEIEILNSNGNPNLNLVFDETKVETKDDFGDETDLVFVFDNGNSSDFSVFKVRKNIRQKRKIGTGSVSSDYTTPDGSITVKAGCWNQSTISQGDKVALHFTPSMSTSHARSIIDETEKMVDTKIKKESVKLTEQNNDRLYQSSNVPANIKLASKYLSAFYIYTEAHKDQFRDVENFQRSFLRRWQNRAVQAFKDFVESTKTSAPKALTFPKTLDQVGPTEDVGGIGESFEQKSSYDEWDQDTGQDDIFESTF